MANIDQYNQLVDSSNEEFAQWFDNWIYSDIQITKQYNDIELLYNDFNQINANMYTLIDFKNNLVNAVKIYKYLYVLVQYQLDTEKNFIYFL